MPEDWECYLAKAKECLRSAHSASGRGLNNCAANRAYYAAYLAELAALQKFAKLSLPEEGWRHPTIVKAFNHRLVRGKKLFESEIIQQVSLLESLRIKADYKTESVSPSEGSECFRVARSIVQAIQKRIDEAT
jgi:uncharacterized protein (UPF0332 family)